MYIHQVPLNEYRIIFLNEMLMIALISNDSA